MNKAAQYRHNGFVVTVTHAASSIIYTQRKVSRKGALLQARLKYPNAQTIHIMGA